MQLAEDIIEAERLAREADELEQFRADAERQTELFFRRLERERERVESFADFAVAI